MKTIGIIGGMSWESTAKYYQWLNEGVRERLGGLHSAKILMTSVDFHDIEKLQSAGEWERAGMALALEAGKLQKGGADLVVLATNTMHLVADHITNALTVPFLHLADATAEKIVQTGIQKIGLLATIYTMEQDFYKQRLQEKGLEVVIPDAVTRVQINKIIFEELCLGKKKPESRQLFLKAANDMLGQGAQGVILGCTEINMLIGQDDFKQPVFDTTRIHVEKAIDRALSL